jgi:hypothetical protein
MTNDCHVHYLLSVDVGSGMDVAVDVGNGLGVSVG